MDGTANLTSVNDTRCYPMDGWEATHNRKVEGFESLLGLQPLRLEDGYGGHVARLLASLTNPCLDRPSERPPPLCYGAR
jgi:hypothetical protein